MQEWRSAAWAASTARRTSWASRRSLRGARCQSLCGHTFIGVQSNTWTLVPTAVCRATIAAYSSGAGGAGLSAALSYAALTSFLAPDTTLFVVCFVPLLLLVGYTALESFTKLLKSFLLHNTVVTSTCNRYYIFLARRDTCYRSTTANEANGIIFESARVCELWYRWTVIN